MKKGFTLLELIVVIVILGVMSTLAATQYTKMVEKSRGSEARIILGSIRTNQAAQRLANGACTSTESAVGIEVGGDAPSTCAGTHYFSYSMTATGTNNAFSAVATRCTGDGKGPQGTAEGTITLITNFETGSDSWLTAAPY